MNILARPLWCCFNSIKQFINDVCRRTVRHVRTLAPVAGDLQTRHCIVTDCGTSKYRHGDGVACVEVMFIRSFVKIGHLDTTQSLIISRAYPLGIAFSVIFIASSVCLSRIAFNTIWCWEIVKQIVDKFYFLVTVAKRPEILRVLHLITR